MLWRRRRAQRRSKLVSKGSEARAERLTALTTAAETVRRYIRHYASKEQSLLSMDAEVTRLRIYGAPEALRKMGERHKASGLKSDEWQYFLLDYTGDVATTIGTYLTQARHGTKEWKGQPPVMPVDPNVALIPNDTELDTLPLALLDAEIARIEKLVSFDRDKANKFSVLSKRITEETAALARLNEQLTDCEGAQKRIEALVKPIFNSSRTGP
jgi:hypothetical protein